jgi:hypothetical protein
LQLYIYGYLNRIQSSRRLDEHPGKNAPASRDDRASFGTIKARMGATHLAAAYDPWKEATAPKTVNQFTSIIAAAEA